MKIRIAFTEDERQAAAEIVKALRRLLPLAKFKETPERDGFLHVYVEERQRENHCFPGGNVV